MVDTITVQVKLNYEGDISLKNRIKYKEVNLEAKPYNKGQHQVGIYAGKIKKMGVWFNSVKGYVLITFNPNKLLERNVDEHDVKLIERSILEFLSSELKIGFKDIELFTLNRIDYKVDCRLNNEEEKQIVYDLMKIATNRFNNIVKVATKTSIRYNPANGYVEFITYDKQHEVIDKGYFYGTEEEFSKKYKNVIRSEIRIKNRKLNYNKKRFGIAKDLINYLSNDMANFYFTSYATKIWFTEPFFRIDIAIKKIKGDGNFSINMKEKLCQLIENIHFLGFSATQKLYAQNYSSVTFRNYIKKIRLLGINPLTFGRKYRLEKLENFSLRECDLKWK